MGLRTDELVGLAPRLREYLTVRSRPGPRCRRGRGAARRARVSQPFWGEACLAAEQTELREQAADAVELADGLAAEVEGLRVQAAAATVARDKLAQDLAKLQELKQEARRETQRAVERAMASDLEAKDARISEGGVGSSGTGGSGGGDTAGPAGPGALDVDIDRNGWNTGTCA
jgi:hypothetical protein